MASFCSRRCSKRAIDVTPNTVAKWTYAVIFIQQDIIQYIDKYSAYR